MRKIEEIAHEEFWNDSAKRESWSLSNTTIVRGFGLVRLFLFGNQIAIRRIGEKDVHFTLAGWNSTTTRSRLSNVAGVPVSSRKFTPVIGRTVFDVSTWYSLDSQGSPVPVNPFSSSEVSI